MQQKKTTQEEYQKCVNAVVDYINLHLGEEIDLKSLARISHFSPFYFHRIMKAFLGEPVGTFIVRTRTEAAARSGIPHRHRCRKYSNSSTEFHLMSIVTIKTL